MEPNNINQEEVQVQQKSPLHQVTPLSKYLAMTLFIILPFVGGYIGYSFAPEKVVEVKRLVVQEVEESEVVVVGRRDFNFQGKNGQVLHECIEDDPTRPLLVILPYYSDDGNITPVDNIYNPGTFCNQVNVIKLLFSNQELIISEFTVATSSDYKSIGEFGFTQQEFLWPERDTGLVPDGTKSNDSSDNLLINISHHSCELVKGVCNRSFPITHIVAFPQLEVTELDTPIGLTRGLGTLKWNAEKTAFVSRSSLHDPTPSFSIRKLSDTNPINYYGEPDTPPERMWDNSEVEWLSEFEVRVLDEVFTLE